MPISLEGCVCRIKYHPYNKQHLVSSVAALTCFLSVAGTWLKYSQACQNKIFSSLNSFLRNSCGGKPEVLYNRKQPIVFLSYPELLLLRPLVRAEITGCNVWRLVYCKCGRRMVWAREADQCGGRWISEASTYCRAFWRCYGLRSMKHLWCGRTEYSITKVALVKRMTSDQLFWTGTICKFQHTMHDYVDMHCTLLAPTG